MRLSIPTRAKPSAILPAAPELLLAAWDHMTKNPRARQKEVYQALRTKFSGIDIAPEVMRLAAMNLYLHGATGVETMIEQKGAAQRGRPRL